MWSGLTALLSSSVIGGLIGAFAIHHLTRSREREVWRRDATLKEWRELLSAFTMTRQEMFDIALTQEKNGQALALVDKHTWYIAQTAVRVTLADRLFIRKEMEELGLHRRWAEASHSFEADGDMGKFTLSFRLIQDAIVRAAPLWETGASTSRLSRRKRGAR